MVPCKPENVQPAAAALDLGAADDVRRSIATALMD